MFVKILGFISLLFLIQCNRGKVDLECGCVRDDNRAKSLVTARVSDDELIEFMAVIVDLQRGGGGTYGGNVRVEGLCTEMDNNRAVFCVDSRDYQLVSEAFRGGNISVREERIN
ncbi:MAG: hypothetical protein OXK80_07010 [Bdellovibrionales bacterium]|nr:hypothetical protein [Bdellovibrionales bacterium]